MKLLIAVVLLVASSQACNIPPKYWCDSAEIALECDALILCQDRFLSAWAAQTVQVDLYYEALCPFCRQFINEQLYPVWSELYSTGIFNTSLIPYGNAKENEVSPGVYEYQCQHGPDECVLNAVENCIMHHSNNIIEVYFPVLNCIEASDQPMTDAPKCVGKSDKFKWGAIEKCANGSQGNMLVHKSAVKTQALSPAHKYVPWIVVNGVHSDEMQNDAQQDLLKFVCDTYTGAKPSQCTSPAQEARTMA